MGLDGMGLDWILLRSLVHLEHLAVLISKTIWAQLEDIGCPIKDRRANNLDIQVGDIFKVWLMQYSAALERE